MKKYKRIMKICNNCGIEKELIDFVKDINKKDGTRNKCKECSNLHVRNDRKINNDKHVKWYKNSNDKRIKNGVKNEVSLLQKEIVKNKYKIYYLLNKETMNNNAKIWRKNNPKYRTKWTKLRKENNPAFKLSCTIRTLVYKSIKNNGYTKKSRTYEILGCTFVDFKIYIQSKFELWMNWDNHGVYTGNYNETWQYDHIKPISLGLSEDEVIKLNHYTNFQPLCSRKNSEKSNYYFSPN
jgi:hypothetical protein